MWVGARCCEVGGEGVVGGCEMVMVVGGCGRV